MPTLIVEDVPREIYERIQRQAQAENRTVAEEVVRLLEQGLSMDGLIYSYPAPFDLPRPEGGIPVQTICGGKRLPTAYHD